MSGSPDSLPQSALEVKSVTLTIPVLLLSSNDLDAIERQLREKVGQAAGFFRQSPFLLDLQALSRDGQAIDLGELLRRVRDLDLAPIGVRGGSEELNRQARDLSLPVHPPAAKAAGGKKAGQRPWAAAQDAPAPPRPEPPVENRIITEPVRSGQRVYARGDLVVTAPVSAGAEIMAEGNIHVYSSLRGRALAGVLGNAGSRIFCMDLRAELISIAGIYQLRDEFPAVTPGKPMKISLENQTLVIQEI